MMDQGNSGQPTREAQKREREHARTEAAKSVELRAVEATRADVRQLHPLLQLLPPENSGAGEEGQPDPIEVLTALLEQLATNQAHMLGMIESLHKKIDRLSERESA